LYRRLKQASPTPLELELSANNRVRDLVHSVHASVPYYQRLFDTTGLTPTAIRGTADLAKLPIMTKQEMITHRGELLSTTVPPGDLGEDSTGGSTGSPFVFHFSRSERSVLNAGLWRANSWFGYEPGRKLVRLWGIERRPHTPGLLSRMVMNTIALSGTEFSDAAVANLTQRMVSFRPEFVEGYGSLLFPFCEAVRRLGLTLPRCLRTAVYSADGLSEPQRRYIEDTLGCPLFQRYGTSEFLAIAVECRERRLHVFTDMLWIEVVDDQGTPLPPGELGRIVITSYYSSAFPFLRYDTQDLGVLSNEGCTCGSPYPVLQEVSGRLGGIVHLPDGRMLSGVVLLGQVEKLDRIGQVQFRQVAPDRLRVIVARSPLFNNAEFSRFQDALGGFLGPHVYLEFEFADHIPRLPSGKYELVYSSAH
jgi:phenylacetate-CoA ligase